MITEIRLLDDNGDAWWWDGSYLHKAGADECDFLHVQIDTFVKLIDALVSEGVMRWRTIEDLTPPEAVE